jgi:putative integral membrane protein (TIGR02587 family)
MQAEAATSAEQRTPWATEAVDVLRAVAGGMLFGIPLIYTMEVWWVGGTTSPARMLLVLGLTFVPVLILNRTGGFRADSDVSWGDAAKDTIEAIAIGLLSVAAILVLLQEITLQTPVTEGLGKIVYESTPFGIGVALAHHFLTRGRDDDDEDTGDDDEGGLNATLADMGATAIGAVFIAFNIAPTDEVPMITAALAPGWLLGFVAASLAISYAIVFEAGFSNEEQRRSQDGVLQHPLTETVAGYLLALAAAAVMLWFFQRIGEGEPAGVSLNHVVVLGLPAAVGGAAGRLAV